MKKKFMMSATNVDKLAEGKYDPKPFNENKSALPKWLLERGMMNYYDFLKTRRDIKGTINYFTKELKRKNISKGNKIMYISIIKAAKEDLKLFSIEYFNAKDVEKAFRDILDKYELVDKSRIIKPKPQDIGKKRYYI